MLRQVDVWAMAVMVYETLYGFPTFGKDKESLTRNILKKQPNFSDDLRNISPGEFARLPQVSARWCGWFNWD